MLFYIYIFLSFLSTMAFYAVAGQAWQVIIGGLAFFAALWIVGVTLRTSLNNLTASLGGHITLILHNQNAIYNIVDSLLLNKCPDLRKEREELQKQIDEFRKEVEAT